MNRNGKEPNAGILRLLQIAGGNFPIGGFSQSYGLETYVTVGRISDRSALEELLRTYVDQVLARCEIPLILATHLACAEKDLGRVDWLNQLGLATKITRESRDAFARSGKAMLRVGVELGLGEEMERFFQEERERGIAFPTAFAMVAEAMKISSKDTALAYAFNSINGLVQAAIKLIPLGNVEGQQVLTELFPALEEACRRAETVGIEEVGNVAPALDLASMEHEDLPVRLYMS